MVGRLGVGVVVAWLAGGCAAAPPGPRGPLSEAGAQFSMDWSVALASARYTQPTAAPFEGNADYFGLNFPIPPRRIGGRLAPVSWADVGADIGWIDGGVDLRLGLPAVPGRFLAGNIAFGLRSGQPGVFQDTKATHSYWGRLEAYPLLLETHNASHRGVVALGLNGGDFFHQLEVPSRWVCDQRYPQRRGDAHHSA